jgi:hypothetical protein
MTETDKFDLDVGRMVRRLLKQGAASGSFGAGVLVVTLCDHQRVIRASDPYGEPSLAVRHPTGMIPDATDC